MLKNAVKAGLLYFAGVFALAFLLGGVRMMLLVPAIGELLAVLVETPVILGFAWLLCRRAIALLQVAPAASARLLMGGVALSVLLIAEVALAMLLFAESPQVFIAGLLTPAGLVGLAGQVVYGLFPLLQLRASGEAVL